MLPKGRTYSLLLKLLKNANQGVIVRSSAVGETISKRGAYESSDCESSVAAVQRSALAILQAARDHDQDCELAIIVQRFEDRHATGHLSNERRVSERSRRWFCELELPDAGERSFRLRADSASKAAKSLHSTDEESLKRVLREVARRMTYEDRRYHLEWLWNGKRMFVVQSDQEEPAPGAVPGQAADLLPTTQATRVRTHIFHSVPRSSPAFPRFAMYRPSRKQAYQ